MTPARRDTAGSGGSIRPLLFASAAAATLLLVYLLHPALEGFRFPIGPDGPVYTWLARLASVEGFGDAPGGGPGVPALTLMLGSALRTEPVETVMVLGPVLAASSGLAAGALLEATLGRDSLRALAAVILTGAFTAFLAGGWLANVAMVAMFLVALAALSAVADSNRSLWSGTALLAAAGLAHRIFIVIGALILLGAAGWRLARSRRGSREERTSALRLGVAAVAGPAAALLTGAWIGVGPRVPADTSQDGFFRRVGLRGLLLDRYRERFLGDAGRATLPAVSGLALASGYRGSRDDERGALLHDVLVSWAALTVAGVTLLLLTGWGPPYRIIQFAFFLPVTAAAGFAVLARRSRTWAIGALLLGAMFVAYSMVGWFRQVPAFSPDEVAASARAGAVASTLPPGTPLVFLVDTDEGAAAYHVSRAANVIRMGVSADRIRDVRIAVGQPEDVLNSRPSLSGDTEHDRISEVYMAELSAHLDDAAILVVHDFNPDGFEEAAEAGVVVADGVAALMRDFEGAADVGRPLDAVETARVAAPAGLSIALLSLLSVASLALLALLGWGWARWILPDAGSHGVALAAPSVGIAVTILATVAADRVGLLPGGAGAMALVGSAGLVGHFLAARR